MGERLAMGHGIASGHNDAGDRGKTQRTKSEHVGTACVVRSIKRQNTNLTQPYRFGRETRSFKKGKRNKAYG